MKNKERVYILTYKGKNLKALRDILQKERLHRKLRGLSVTLQTEVTVYGESLIIGKAEMIQLLKGAKVKFEDGLKIKALSELITDKLGKAENPIAKAKRKEAEKKAEADKLVIEKAEKEAAEKKAKEELAEKKAEEKRIAAEIKAKEIAEKKANKEAEKKAKADLKKKQNEEKKKDSKSVKG